MEEEWILHPQRHDDPEQRLLWQHLQALSQLAQLDVVEGAVSSEGLFRALDAVVPLLGSVVYDLRELLDFLTRMDEERAAFVFRGSSRSAYAERVCEALVLAAETFTWRLSSNRTPFVPRFKVGTPPPLPLPLAS
jgi:hypothetical protein